MSEKLKELAEIPQEFVRDGQQVSIVDVSILCLGLTSRLLVPHALHEAFAEGYVCIYKLWTRVTQSCTEFVQICKAVAVGFAVMGFIGYFVKLIHIPMYVPSAPLSITPHAHSYAATTF